MKMVGTLNVLRGTGPMLQPPKNDDRLMDQVENEIAQVRMVLSESSHSYLLLELGSFRQEFDDIDTQFCTLCRIFDPREMDGFKETLRRIGQNALNLLRKMRLMLEDEAKTELAKAKELFAEYSKPSELAQIKLACAEIDFGNTRGGNYRACLSLTHGLVMLVEACSILYFEKPNKIPSEPNAVVLNEQHEALVHDTLPLHTIK